MRIDIPAALIYLIAFSPAARAGEEATPGAPAAGKAPLRLEVSIPLPISAGRIDHLALDPEGRKLFVAALANGTVEVVDLAAAKAIHTIRGLTEPQGILFIPGARVLAVASGGEDGSLRLYDGDRFQPRATLGPRPDADNLRHDPKAGRIYLGYGEGALSIVDALRASAVGEVKLAGHPESFQLEKKGPRIFVNVPSARQVAVVDREKAEVIGTFRIEGAEANFPMALDEDRKRLLLGCRKPPRLVVLDTETGKQVAIVETSGDADDLFLDPSSGHSSGRVYISCGEGFIDVFRREGDRYEREARVETAPGARTSLLTGDPARLYLAVPRRGDRTAEIRVYAIGP